MSHISITSITVLSFYISEEPIIYGHTYYTLNLTDIATKSLTTISVSIIKAGLSGTG